jgi:hypothetical protein
MFLQPENWSDSTLCARSHSTRNCYICTHLQLLFIHRPAISCTLRNISAARRQVASTVALAEIIIAPASIPDLPAADQQEVRGFSKTRIVRRGINFGGGMAWVTGYGKRGYRKEATRAKRSAINRAALFDPDKIGKLNRSGSWKFGIELSSSVGDTELVRKYETANKRDRALESLRQRHPDREYGAIDF